MNVLIIPDLHVPYHHPDAFDFLADVARQHDYDRIVCIGDEIDAHAFGRWPPHPDLDSPGKELESVVKQLKPLYKLFPQVDVVASNHTYRPWKQAYEAGLPTSVLRSIREVLEAPKKWRWHERLVINKVLYFHGDGYGGAHPAYKAMLDNRMSVVIGHVHTKAAVYWSATRFDRIFGMSTGCLIDANKLAFSYAKFNANRPMLGCAQIVDNVPMVVPLR